MSDAAKVKSEAMYLTAGQAADILCLSRRTFFRLVKGGRLPAAALRLSRKTVRWLREDIEGRAGRGAAREGEA